MLPMLTEQILVNDEMIGQSVVRTGSRLLEEPTLDKRLVGDLRSLSLDLLLTCPPEAGWKGPCTGEEPGSGVPTLQGHETLGDLQLPTPLEIGILVILLGPSSGMTEVTIPRPWPPNAENRSWPRKASRGAQDPPSHQQTGTLLSSWCLI